jgi:hypothetical protein
MMSRLTSRAFCSKLFRTSASLTLVVSPFAGLHHFQLAMFYPGALWQNAM